ncbi:MAG: Anthranilate phosphoribosyltransferase [Methanomassiliicoccales archaeon PtaB.Bin215]|nr:MAG: Anthranilate phosphoribosyltransferase [Methanomassiliicoccales archaeon PtaB.Bin215]
MDIELREFGTSVDALIRGEHIGRRRTRDMFREVLLNQQPDLQQGAFLAALTSARPTPEEIAGAWEAIFEIDTEKARPEVDGYLVENCGTGMDRIKTFNVSTLASVVAAAGGVYMAKHGARAITSRCGIVDMAETLGVDVECEVSVVKRSVEVAGIGLFNGMSAKVHPQALYRILSQVRFGTILNVAGSLANPASPEVGVRGVYSRELVLPLARTMREMGYRKGIVAHGLDGNGERGMDELSTLGRSIISEFHEDGEVSSYDITPQGMGLPIGQEKEILSTLDRETEALRFIRVLLGKESGSRRDMVALNTAPMLYLNGNVSSLEEGVAKALDILESGKGFVKLKDWVRAQSSGDPGERLERLERMAERA